MNEEMHKNCGRVKLSVCGLAMASGITWGLAVFLVGVMSMKWHLGDAWVELLKSLYVGFEATWKGSFIGLGWGFLDGLVCGIVFAIIYNLVACKCPCPGCKAKRS